MKEATPHIAEYKKKEVEEIKRLLQEYPIFGIVNMENLPSAQLQKMRSQLKGTALIKMTKRRLVKIAIEGLKGKIKGIEKVEEYLKGMPALIFTKENPFRLYKFLGRSKTSAAAKPGQTAPKDLIIPAGATSFTPGPIIGELGQMGIKTTVENGKIVVKDDSVLVKEGAEINAKAAELLQKMGIEPMEIGLNLLMVFENGLIFAKDVLAVDETAYTNDVRRIASEAMNLALNARYFARETVEILLKKAVIEAKAVAEEGDILTEERAAAMVGQANQQMESLKSKLSLPEELEPEEPKPEPKQEQPREEKKEGPKEEKKKKPKGKAEEKLKDIPEKEPKEKAKPGKKPSAEKIVKEAEGMTKEEKEEKERKEVEKIAQDILSGKRGGQ